MRRPVLLPGGRPATAAATRCRPWRSSSAVRSADGRPGGARGPVATGRATDGGRRRGLRRGLAGGTAGRRRGHRRGLRGRPPVQLQTWATVLRCRDDDGPMPELTPSELARLAVSLTDVDLRDALVAWICPGALTLDLVPEALREQMVDVLPAPLRHDAEPGSTRPSTRPVRSGWSAGSWGVRRASRGLERRPVDRARVLHLVAWRRCARPDRAGPGAGGGSRLPAGAPAGPDGRPRRPAVGSPHDAGRPSVEPRPQDTHGLMVGRS